jgi:hypothetical protein
MSGSRDPVEEWRDVSARAARATGYRPNKRSQVAGPLPGLSIGIVAAGLVIVVAGLALRPPSTAMSSSPPSAGTSDAPSPTAAPTPSPTLSADARTALATVQAYETALADEKSDVAWRLLSPWSRTAIGSFGTFAAVERRASAGASNLVIAAPSQDPELLGAPFLGPRAEDLAVSADPSRTFLVSVRDPDVDGVAAATLNLVAAPLENGSWRIWLDVSPGRFGAAAYPEGCAAFGLSMRRCDFIVADARSGQGIDPGLVTTTWLLPDPGCGGDPTTDELTMCMRTQSFVVGVEFELSDRTTERRDYFCGVGGQTTLICSDAPQIDASDFHAAGYWDTPCAGEAPDGCASPVPVPTGAAAEGARALDLASIDLPIGAVGHHEVEIGTAVLAGGVVQEARFSLGDQRQDGYLLDPGRVQLVLRSTIAGRPPFDNIHARGVFDRPETVRVLLVFDVAEVSGEHWIHVTDVEVR